VVVKEVTYTVSTPTRSDCRRQELVAELKEKKIEKDNAIKLGLEPTTSQSLTLTPNGSRTKVKKLTL
jgi:hypothetical protein